MDKAIQDMVEETLEDIPDNMNIEWQPSGCDQCDETMFPQEHKIRKLEEDIKLLRELNTKVMKELTSAKKFINDTKDIVFAILSDEELFALASKKMNDNKSLGFELGAKTI